MYIPQVRLSCITNQNFYYLASNLTDTNSSLVSNFHYLASTLTNTNDIFKVNPYYLVNTLTNTNDITDNFIKKRLVISK